MFLVLACQLFGGSGTECGNILAFLVLPHATHFSKSTVHTIETNLNLFVNKITNQVTKDSIEEEVSFTLQDDNKYNEWEQKLPMSAVGLTVSYDMGWQKRSSGSRYDSESGHSSIIGKISKKIITLDLPNLWNSMKCLTW